MFSKFRFKVVVCGSVGIVILSLLGRTYFLKKKQERAERKLIEDIKSQRIEQSKMNREINLDDNLRCVVCLENKKEIILLPCGHVCLCFGCSNQIISVCPICRKLIQSKSKAFIS